MINSEQIRFHQKRGVETEEKNLSQAHLLWMEGNSPDEILFEIGLIYASNFGVGAGVTLLTVRF